MALSLLGYLFPYCHRSPLHLAGKLGNAHVGFPPLRHQRHLPQQLLGSDAHLRRRLAQQPPRSSAILASRPLLVRVRSQLVRHLRPANLRPRLGRQSPLSPSEIRSCGRRLLTAKPSDLSRSSPTPVFVNPIPRPLPPQIRGSFV